MIRGQWAWRMAPVVAVVAVLCSGCATSKYDVKLEAAASDWQAQISAFITDQESKAGTPGGEFEPNKQFYDGVQQSIGGETARIKAASGSSRAIEILELLSKDVENLRKLHETGGKAGLTQAMGEGARTAIETELRALNKLESEYRSGNEPPPAPPPPPANGNG